jgi:hypothetical protein
MIIFPIIFLVTLAFVFTSSLTDVIQYQTIMNCPFPINGGVANLTAFQSPPQINYTQTFDSNTGDYHVTTFECEFDPTSQGASINTRVYTADVGNSWFDIGALANGYMFYVSEVIDTIGIRINAFGGMLNEFLFAPEQVTGLVFFTYIQTVLFLLIGIGVFLAIRGG